MIFDLDGTLIDTLEGITIAVNKFLKYKNINLEYSKDTIRTFIGNGAELLFKRFMKDNSYNDKDYELFLKFYRDNQKYSVLFKNVDVTLQELNKKNIKLFILSNKPDELLQTLIPSLLKDIKFEYIQGQDKNYPIKPDVTLLNEKIIKKYNLNINNGFYVGDSYVDVLTGKNANLKTILVTYGYGKLEDSLKYNPDYIIDDFKDVLEIIKWAKKKNCYMD